MAEVTHEQFFGENIKRVITGLKQKDMRQVITKHPFELGKVSRIKVPIASSILFVEKLSEDRIMKTIEGPTVYDLKEDVPHVWVIHEPDTDREEVRVFESVLDGDEIESKGRRYIGSLNMSGILWHVFEKQMTYE